MDVLSPPVEGGIEEEPEAKLRLRRRRVVQMLFLEGLKRLEGLQRYNTSIKRP